MIQVFVFVRWCAAHFDDAGEARHTNRDKHVRSAQFAFGQICSQIGCLSKNTQIVVIVNSGT
jgi:hypothetical protein